MELAVIFDMDGVIVENTNFHQKAWEKFSQKYNLDFSEEKFKNDYFGKTNDQILPEMFNKELPEKEIKKLGDEKEAIYREIFQPHLKPLKGLVPLLEELRRCSIPIGVATSAPRDNVDFVLDGLDIRKYIKTIVDDSMVVRGKPYPEIYRKSAEMLGVNPENCVVFEDSMSGTKSAFDAGAKVVAVTTTLPAEKHKLAHKIISDFNDVSLDMLEALFE